MFQNSKLNWLYVLLAVSTVSMMPGVISFLPDQIEEYIRGVSGIITLVCGMLGFRIPNESNKTDEK